ncbi:MAG: adenylyltransferase/cytidyltransferase family protein [Raoultibacter sp.]
MLGGKKVVITYGTYDLLHFGHIALLKRAKALGDYLIVGVTSDAFDKTRGKLNVSQPLAERLRAIQDTGIVDKIVVEEYQGQKIADIKKYGVDVFTVGSDWEGKFDYLNKYCEVVYLERTRGVSSTELRTDRIKPLALGCVGSDYLVERFLRESQHVGGVSVTHGFSRGSDEDFCARNGLVSAASFSELCAVVDAVYISEPIDRRYACIETALEAGCHVLCESPLFLSEQEGRDLCNLAARNNLVLMEAVKTLYLPAFQHLKLLLESGVIGEVKDIDASFSHVFEGLDKRDRYQGSFYDMASYITLPAIAFLGSEYVRADFACSYDGQFCTWAKCAMLYASASATLRVGRGVKTEGDLVITGTEGYVYVPAPWWKTEYFEVRMEDLRNTKKYFYGYAGEGQRYELFEFVRLINSQPEERLPMQKEEEVLAVARLVEQFDAGDVAVLAAGEYHFGGGESVVDR